MNTRALRFARIVSPALPLVTLAAVGVAESACNGLIALDGYHTCTDTPDACTDGGGSTDGGAPDGGNEASGDANTSCTKSVDCTGSASVCSAGKCTSVRALAQGSSLFSCAVLTDGHVMCWGPNADGELGTGNTTASPTPAPVKDLGDVAEVALAFASACARTNQGAVWCWGQDDRGILGTPNAGPQSAPVPVSLGLKATSIAVGPGIGCAVTSDASVWCWGNNSVGSLDMAKDGGVLGPTKLPVANAVSVHVNGYGVCVLHDQNQLACWGNDDVGLFAIPKAQIQHKGFVATNVTLTAPSELRMGEIHACAIAGGKLSCWGDDECNVASASSTAGNCNNSFSTVVAQPTAVLPLLDVAHVSPQYVDTCVLQTKGQVRCWGRNQHGTLGTNTVISSGDFYGSPSTDVQLVDGGTLTNVVQLASHRQFACAVTSDGALYCWGENIDGASIGPPGGDRPYASRVAWP